jgi:hypothetical protein
VGLTEARAVRDIRPEGLFSVEAGNVRLCDVPLHIAQDEIHHAEIQGMPVYKEDEGLALRIANYLVRSARVCA